MNAQTARNLTIAALSVDIDTILEWVFTDISNRASAGHYDYFYSTDDIPLQSDIEQLNSRLQELGYLTSVFDGLEHDTRPGIRIMWR